MNRKQLADRIGNIDDRLVQQAEDVPNYARLRREKRLKRLAGMAAVLVLMACSGAVGALAFSRETVTEVPAEQEQVVLREIGVTLLLPDSWKGRYEVVEDTFAPYGSAMWEFCVRSVYEAKTPIEGAGGSFYRGTLFTVLQCADYSMSAEEFAQGGLAGIGQYLFCDAGRYLCGAVRRRYPVRSDGCGTAAGMVFHGADREGHPLRAVRHAVVSHAQRRTARGGAYVPRRVAFYLWDISRPGAGMPPAAPFLSAAKEMGGERRQKPKAFGFPFAACNRKKTTKNRNYPCKTKIVVLLYFGESAQLRTPGRCRKVGRGEEEAGGTN